jgi:hypothetical protein
MFETLAVAGVVREPPLPPIVGAIPFPPVRRVFPSTACG